MFQSCGENQNTNLFFPENISVYNKVEKYFRAGQATDGNMAHAHCMLYT